MTSTDTLQAHLPRDDDLANWLALLHAPGVGSAAFKVLIDHLDSLDILFDASREQLAGCGLKPPTLDYLKNPDWKAVDRIMAWAEHADNHIITLKDANYPGLLREIPDPPPVLFVCGNVELLSTQQLAIVGSRNPCAAGKETAEEFACYLSNSGLVITSGLALGIDAASHTGALSGSGLTIAVTGTGLDRVYPARHRKLAHRIADQGALVSEFTPGTPPLPNHFPRRNRIISGLSLGTLVVEAAARSGSLITARLAAEQGREVFAIPGSIHNPLARGCHQLLRNGAKLVETATDILEELATFVPAQVTPSPALAREIKRKGLDKPHADILESLAHDSLSVDQLVERCGLTPDIVSSMLLVLELHGYVSPVSGGLYTSTPSRSY